MEEEGEKERKKEKPGVILASKRKRQKVKSVLGGCFLGGCFLWHRGMCEYTLWLCVHTSTPNHYC